MLLVKKCNYLHFLFSVKLRLEIRFNNVLDRKKNTFFDNKDKMFQGPKTRTFPKGLTHTFGKKNAIFLNFLFSVKITLEIRFHNVLDRKKIITNNENNFSQSQKSYFFKGVNPSFW